MTFQILRAGGLGEHELEALRQFDLTGRYGPCTGITRLQRCAHALPQQTGRPASVLTRSRPATMTCTTCTLWPPRHGQTRLTLVTRSSWVIVNNSQTCVPQPLASCSSRRRRHSGPPPALKLRHLAPRRAAVSGLYQGLWVVQVRRRVQPWRASAQRPRQCGEPPCDRRLRVRAVGAGGSARTSWASTRRQR